MLQTIPVILILLFSLSACSDEVIVLPQHEAQKKLTGNYRLFFDKSQRLIKNKKLISSSLVLLDNGTCVQECVNEGSETFVVKSSWSYTQYGDVCIMKFNECSHVWPQPKQGMTKACLPVVWGDTPMLFVSKDLGVFYSR